MNRIILCPAVILFISLQLIGCAEKVEEVVVHRVTADGSGSELGVVRISETSKGVQFSPDLHGLPPGEHGFHVHENPSCDAMKRKGVMIPALAAGGHYDPEQTGRHEGPEGKGHRGDLPRLMVDADGVANQAVIAPRLTMNDLEGRSLMIHAGGDNYSDTPPMGGGGARIACGVIR